MQCLPCFKGVLQHVGPASCLQEAEFHVTQEETDIYPDFVTIARGFGVPSKRVRHPSELRAAIREMLDTPGPFLLDVMVQTIPLERCRDSSLTHVCIAVGSAPAS